MGTRVNAQILIEIIKENPEKKPSELAKLYNNKMGTKYGCGTIESMMSSIGIHKLMEDDDGRISLYDDRKFFDGVF